MTAKRDWLQYELHLCDEIDATPVFAECSEIMLAAEGKLPEWIPLVPSGKTVKAFDGRTFSNAKPQDVVDAFKADPRDLPLDWEHATEKVDERGGTAPAAAWIDDMEVRDGAIWGHVKEWTQKGAASVETKEYRYISPAVLFQKASKLISRIVSAALVNRPAFDMPAIARSETFAEWSTAYVNDLPDSAFLFVESGGDKDGDGKTVPRSLRHFPYKDSSGGVDLPHLRNAIARIPQSRITGLDDTAKRNLQTNARNILERATRANAREETMDREKLIVKLGLAKEATDEEIFAAIAKLQSDPVEELKKAAEELAKAKAELKTTSEELANARAASPSLSEYVPRSDFDAVVAREKALMAEKSQREESERKQKIESTVDDAVKAGKIIPASRDKYVAMCASEEGFKTFQELVETLPVIVEPTDLDHRQPPIATTANKPLSDEEKAVAKEWGFSEAEFAEQKEEARQEAMGR